MIVLAYSSLSHHRSLVSEVSERSRSLAGSKRLCWSVRKGLMSASKVCLMANATYQGGVGGGTNKLKNIKTTKKTIKHDK